MTAKNALEYFVREAEEKAERTRRLVTECELAFASAKETEASVDTLTVIIKSGDRELTADEMADLGIAEPIITKFTE